MQGRVASYDTDKGVRWYYVFDVPRGADGKRKQKKVSGFPTKKAALAAMQAELVARRSPSWVEPSAEPMASYLNRWLEDVAPTLATSTVHGYRDQIAHLTRCFGSVAVGTLSTADVNACYRELVATRLAPSTLRHTHAVLRGALKQAVRQRLRADNPAEHATLPAVRAGEVAVWSPAEAKRFLRETGDSPDHALWRLLLDTAMRVGEALALTWAHVDLDKGTVRVGRTLSRNEDERFAPVERVKTTGGRRTVRLTDGALSALKAHKVAQTERRLRASFWHDEGFVFDRRDGRFLHPRTVQDRFRAACEEAGVTVLTLKGLRHTTATLAAADGVPLHTIMQRLGHTNIALTAGLYAHRSDEADQGFAEAMARVLGG